MRQTEAIWNTLFSIFERWRGPQMSRGPGKLSSLSPSRRACIDAASGYVGSLFGYNIFWTQERVPNGCERCSCCGCCYQTFNSLNLFHFSTYRNKTSATYWWQYTRFLYRVGFSSQVLGSKNGLSTGSDTYRIKIKCAFPGPQRLRTFRSCFQHFMQ